MIQISYAAFRTLYHNRCLEQTATVPHSPKARQSRISSAARIVLRLLLTIGRKCTNLALLGRSKESSGSSEISVVTRTLLMEDPKP